MVCPQFDVLAKGYDHETPIAVRVRARARVRARVRVRVRIT